MHQLWASEAQKLWAIYLPCTDWKVFEKSTDLWATKGLDLPRLRVLGHDDFWSNPSASKSMKLISPNVDPYNDRPLKILKRPYSKKTTTNSRGFWTLLKWWWTPWRKSHIYYMTKGRNIDRRTLPHFNLVSQCWRVAAVFIKTSQYAYASCTFIRPRRILRIQTPNPSPKQSPWKAMIAFFESTTVGLRHGLWAKFIWLFQTHTFLLYHLSGWKILFHQPGIFGFAKCSGGHFERKKRGPVYQYYSVLTFFGDFSFCSCLMFYLASPHLHTTRKWIIEKRWKKVRWFSLLIWNIFGDRIWTPTGGSETICFEDGNCWFEDI